ncbi:MAG: hypothetical protein ACRECH_14275 [Nitrososphaerales archaeon]
MPETRGSNNTRGSAFASAHYVPDARGLDAGNRGKVLDGARAFKNQTDSDRIGYLLFVLERKNVLRVRSDLKSREFSISFLAKLADSIVSLRGWLKDENKPILHLAILSTLLEFYGGVHSQEVSEAAALLEEMICEDVEFKLLNK